MARTVWCRECYAGYAVVAGVLPDQCPACDLKPALWTTLYPGSGWAVPLSYWEKRFLRRLKIDPEEEEPL